MSLTVYTPRALAEILGLDPTWVERRVTQHPHHRFGRKIRLTEADAMAFIEAHAVLAGTDAPAEVPAALLELRPGRAPRGRRAKPADAATA
ncbi:helix-turn-helix domain-containing protein [Kitasatospora purpeofusca]|uniref:helix-turn-helix domain-containing protein n=1 Tax=Kitasatospora purpeofusca TaxID=67352 RepID=UPI0035DCD041